MGQALGTQNILIKIQYAYPKLTDTEKTIANWFLNNKSCLDQKDLADKLHVSCASISRFSKKIGLSNYKELSYLYRDYLENKYKVATKKLPSELADSYMRIIEGIDNYYSHDDIAEAARLIYEHDNIFIFALGLSATAAQDFKFRFSRIGKRIEVIYDKDAMKMTLPFVKQQDLVLVFTLRSNKELEKYAQYLNKKKISIISICANSKSDLIETSSLFLMTENLKDEEKTGIISNQIPILIIIDAIYYYYAKTYKDVINKWYETEQAIDKL